MINEPLNRSVANKFKFTLKRNTNPAQTNGGS